MKVNLSHFSNQKHYERGEEQVMEKTSRTMTRGLQLSCGGPKFLSALL
jgi:hypothetical protein